MFVLRVLSTTIFPGAQYPPADRVELPAYQGNSTYRYYMEFYCAKRKKPVGRGDAAMWHAMSVFCLAGSMAKSP
jgi:hypothetical protein